MGRYALRRLSEGVITGGKIKTMRKLNLVGFSIGLVAWIAVAIIGARDHLYGVAFCAAVLSAMYVFALQLTWKKYW